MSDLRGLTLGASRSRCIGAGRRYRRIAVVTAVAMVLSVGLPSGVLHAGGFPLSGLWSWMSAAPAWASAGQASLGVPVQSWAGGAAGHDHDVPTSVTRANGGSGRAPGRGIGAIDATKPTAPAVRPSTTPARAGEHSFNEATSRRVPERASANSDVFENADGSFTRRMYAGVANYRGADGVWRPIDARLVDRAGRWQVAANSVGVSLSRRGSADPGSPGRGGIDGMVAVRLASGEVFAYGLTGAADVAAAVDGTTATYPSVLPGVDLQLDMLTTGVKETLVLASAAAGSTWTFPIRLDGLTATVESDGSLALRGSAGSVVAVVPLGEAHDANVDAASGEAPSTPVTYQLVTLDGGVPGLRVSIDSAWLNDPVRRFPVRVDPTVTTTVVTGDVYVDSDPSTVNQNGDNYPVGTYNTGTVKARSFLAFYQFDDDGLMGKRIASVTLKVYHTWSYDCNHHLPVYVHRATSPWTVADLGDNGTLADGPSYSAPIATLQINDNYPACTNVNGVRSIGAWRSASLPVGTFNDWSSGGPNYGLALTASESDSYSWKRFTSGNYSSGTYQAKLDVTWENNITPQVDATYPVDGQAVSTLTPELLVAARDPDGFPKSLTYQYKVYDATTMAVVASSPAPYSGRSWTVSPAALGWGKTYLWSVVASDGLLSSPEIKYVLRTPVPQPLVTSGLSQNSGVGFEPSVGNYTTSATDATVASVGPALSVQRHYNSQDPRVTAAFGAGWSSLLDASAVERLSPGGNGVVAVVVTFPNGQQAAFGRNDNGSFASPPGRYASLSTESGGGYKLIEKDLTKYVFAQAAGTGRYKLTSVSDAAARTLTLGYQSGQVATVTSASGRALHLTWNTPSGATAAHVASVATDRADPADPNSVNTWNYGYSGDSLVTVCPPTSTTACTGYGYAMGPAPGSLYQTVALNAGPHSYWRLTETSGTSAESSVIERAGVDKGIYSNVTLGQAGPLAGSGATAIGLNGTTSSVALPGDLVSNAADQSVSLWFKTSGVSGVLLGQSWDDPTTTATSSGAYQPVLYVGTDGKLRGQFPAAVGASTLGTLVGWGSGRCLAVDGNSSADATRIVLADCSSAANLQWSYTAAKELRVTTGGVVKCMDASAAGTADGTDVISYTCTGGVNQKWTVGSDGFIRGDQAGRCLDAEGFGTASGTKIQLWACGPSWRASPSPQTNQAFFPTAHTSMTAAPVVNNGAWHHAVLTAAGNVQTLYLDGLQVGQLTGALIQDIDPRFSHLGVGYLGGGWPGAGTGSATTNLGTKDYVNGSMAEVAVYDRTLLETEVAELYAANRAVHPLTDLTRPTGVAAAHVVYNPVTSRVSQVTDSNAGVWGPHAATVAGTPLVYSAAALELHPRDYWRMAETGVTQAVNQINGNVASYSSVTLGVAGGPLSNSDNPTTVASFNGTSSYVALPTQEIPAASGTMSVGLWFKTASGYVAGGTLFSYQTNAVTGSNSAQGNWMPALYIGTDGKLRGKFCWCGGSTPITTSAAVTDGNWHHAVLAAAGTDQRLYLDGALVGSVSSAIEGTSAQFAYLGAGETNGWPARPTNSKGYLSGQLAEATFFPTQLSAAQVASLYAARGGALAKAGVSYTVDTPDDGQQTTVRDLRTGARIAEINALGAATYFGYDSSGFLHTLTDPNGNVTINEHDIRGNLVSATTCQDYSANLCSTAYYTHFPDNSSTVLIPDARNDKPLTERGPGSSSPSDTTYLTTYAYDSVSGDRTQMVDPLGRVTLATYTTTATAAYGGGTTKAGLPATMTTPGGAVQTLEYYANGDLARQVDPAGKVTVFTYDGLGRILTTTDTTASYPSGLTTTNTYDRAGRVLTTTDPPVTNRVTGAVHTARTVSTYNDDGELLTSTVTDLTGGDASRGVTYVYNSLGQLDHQTDEMSHTTSHSYDEYGRVQRTTYPDGTSVATHYNHIGQQTETIVEDWVGDPNNPGAPTDLTVASMAYDPGGRLAIQTDAMGWETRYTYTDNDLLATLTRKNPSNGATFVHESNSYSAAGNLTTQVTNNNLTTTTFSYDNAGRRTSSTVDPGTGHLNRATTYSYSADDLPISTTTTGPTSATVVEATHSLVDPLGRVMAASTDTDPIALAGRWPLDETSGTLAADSAGNSPATLSGGVSWSSEHGGSATFDGVGGSSIAAPGPVLDTTADYSVAAWVKLPTTPTGNKTAVSQDGTQRSAFFLGYELSTNKWRMTVCAPNVANGACVTALSTNTAAMGTWVHLVGTFEMATGKVRLYLNGQAQGTSTKTPGFSGALGALRIGRAQWNGGLADHWPGSIDDVQAYQKLLSATDVSALYAGTAPAAGAGTVRTAYTLDNDGSLTSVRDPRGNTTYIASDELGRPVVATSPGISSVVGEADPLATTAVSWAGYNTFGELTEAKTPTGNTTIYRFDAVGQLTQTQLASYTPPGTSTPLEPVTSHTYDSAGQLASTTDPTGATTAYTYDQMGRLARVTAPGGPQTTYTYNLVGAPLSTTDPTGAQTTATYDYLGRTLTSTEVVRQDSQSYTTTYDYQAGTWPATVTSPAGVVTTLTYTKVGEVETIRDAANNTTRYDYNALGQPTKTTLPDNTYTTVDYDLLGRATTQRSYDAVTTLLRTMSQSYDRAGNVVSATDGRSHTSTFSYDALDRLTAQVEPINSSTSITNTFGYDAADNPTRLVDGRGNRFITTYNSWGLPESRIEPVTSAYPALADRSFTVGYDIAGRPSHLAMPGGVGIDNTYDALGQLIGQSGSAAEAATASRTFGYDDAGRLTNANVSGGASNSFTWDDRSLLRTTSGASGTASFSYTPDGEMASRTDAGGTTSFTYQYGRLANASNSTVGLSASYFYTPNSQVDHISYGSGADARWFGYDGLHRLTTDELKTSAGASVAKITYGFDGNDNLSSKTTTGFSGAAARTYTYDWADRLLSQDDGTTITSYAWDSAGNRTQAGTRTFSYNERNQLTSSSGPASVSYSYTARGTLSATTTTGVGTVATTADAYGQVITQDSAPSTPVTYSYDALGRVLATGMVYTGLDNTLASDGGTNYARDPDGGLLALVSGGTSRLTWTDQHDDLVAQFSATGTSLAGSASYDPFGKVIASSGTLGTLGYQSEWTDAATGRVNMHARWYNPDTAAFDTRDDANLSASPTSVRANRYTYADANPLTNTDPTGHAVTANNEVGCTASADQCELVYLQSKADSQQQELNKATKDGQTSLLDVLIQVGIGFLLDMIGYNDAVNCFGRGDVGACVSLVLGAIPWGKALKLTKSVFHAVEAGIKGFKMWKRIVNGARTVINKVSAGLNQIRKRIDDLKIKIAKSPHAPPRAPKVPGSPAKKTTPKAPDKPPAAKPARPSKPSTSPKAPDKPHKADAPQQHRVDGDSANAKGAKDHDQPERTRDPDGDPAEGASCSVPHSFSPDTRVALADGTTRAISEITVGDRVLASDPSTGASSAQPVTLLHQHHDHDLVALTVAATPAASGPNRDSVGEGEGERSTRGPTTAVLHTTASHPFWDATTRSWTNAADLDPHRSTLLAPDGRTLAVLSVHRYSGDQRMHDLTINSTHTYYVLAGATPVLVHNSDGDCLTERLQGHVDRAVERFESGELTLTGRQVRALDRARGNAAKWTSLYAAFRGQRIDAAAKSSMHADEVLRARGIYITRSGEAGPDVHDIATGRWWDITTPAAWGRHMDSYRKSFGWGTLLSTAARW